MGYKQKEKETALKIDINKGSLLNFAIFMLKVNTENIFSKKLSVPYFNAVFFKKMTRKKCLIFIVSPCQQELMDTFLYL